MLCGLKSDFDDSMSHLLKGRLAHELEYYNSELKRSDSHDSMSHLLKECLAHELECSNSELKRSNFFYVG